MMDPRYNELAKLLVEYSTELKKGEHVLLYLSDLPEEMGVALIRACRKVGAHPHIDIKQGKLSRELLMDTDEEHVKTWKEWEMARMKKMQAFIAIRGAYNTSEASDVPGKQNQMYSKLMRPVQNYRVNKTKWVVLRWPTSSMAQAANMSTEAFEDFYFRVCTMDYKKMKTAMMPLQKRMQAADQVHIKGPGTDLTFSIKDINAIMCSGDRNIPDGEVFSCPIKNSVNGTLQYNTPTVYAGTRFENVYLEFNNGKIVKATCNDTDKLNQILDTDKGARYIGEFSLGTNPHIMNPMCDILFDEKITGSFHFTPGQAYEDADNGNKSAVHWDMVCIQRPEYGGGEVYFDGELIRKDGEFVPKDLKKLNPQFLR